MKKSTVIMLVILAVVLLLLCALAVSQRFVKTDVDATNTVTVSAVHENGKVLLPPTQVPLPDGANVLEALSIAAKEEGVPVALSGTKPNRYVEGIGGLFTADEGPFSGWIYYVNGEAPLVGADQLEIQDGDHYRFFYIKDFMAVE